MDPAPAPAPTPAPSPRLASIDAYRGFVMLLMMGEALRLKRVAQALPDSGLWQFLAFHQSHVEWVGASLHDMIQPSFSFLVGVALPFSIAARRTKGQSDGAMAWHAAGRAVLLVLLGVFLRSVGRNLTHWTFEDTLTQIGLGYFFLFLLGLRPQRDQVVALGAILVGYWAAFAAWPLPPAGFNPADVGVKPEWLAVHGLTGFAAHWQKNANLAWAFDTWFMNLFPREKPFLFNGGGYSTLSFIPTLGTMLLGAIAGGVMRDGRPAAERIRWLLLVGVGGIVGGLALGWLGICPVVKRIWTPSWVLFSGGWCCLLLAAFHGAIDLAGWRRWAFPLVVVGANSIAAYFLAHGFDGYVAKNLTTHLGAGCFRLLGPAFEPLLLGGATLAVLWLVLWWMYRRRIFVKI